MRGTRAKQIKSQARMIAREMPTKAMFFHGGLKYIGFRRVYQDLKIAYLRKLI